MSILAVASQGDCFPSIISRSSRQKFIPLLALLCFILSACALQDRPQPNPAVVNLPLDTAGPGSFTTATRLPSATPTSSPQAPAITLTPTLEQPSATPTPLGCWSEPGQVITGTLATDLLPASLDFRVYTPPCYAVQVERRYPVLYLIHGQSYTDDQWQRLGVPETADAFIRSGDLPPFIVVMPRDRNCCGQPSTDKFADALVQRLVPYVDMHYRTLADRAHRAVGGLSRGAGWAVHLAFTHPELFSAVGAHSPAVMQEDAPRLRSWITDLSPNRLPRIFIDMGDKDRPEISESTRWFESLLMEKHVPHEFYLFVGYHDETYWRAHVPNYLRWYASAWME